MTVSKLKFALKSSSLRRNDVEWFPRWLDQFRRFLGAGGGNLPVERERVIAFLRHIKAHGKAVWQRLQAVRAIEFYRDRVLKTQKPDLVDIRETLAQAAERERDARRKGESSPSEIGMGPTFARCGRSSATRTSPRR